MAKTRLEEMKEQCNKFHAEHPEVWDLFVKFTFQMINRGYKNYSAKGVFERIRWEKDAGGDGVTQFKLGNNYTAFYSRRFMRIYPEHDGFFRLRQQTSESRDATNLPEISPGMLREMDRIAAKRNEEMQNLRGKI